jgi:hypothetical protein
MMMFEHQRFAFLVITTLCCRGSSFAFAPAAPRRTFTSLSLLPTQGSQLEAAYNAQCFQRFSEDDEDSDGDCIFATATPPRPIASARAFVSRVFSSPSSRLHPDEESILSSVKFDHHRNDNDDDDVVLYPIVGFCLMQDADVVRALPTVSRPACRIAPPQERMERLYGWFSPACRVAP